MADPATGAEVVASTFYAKDIVTIIALIIGPMLAVGVTLWAQSRSEKRGAKIRLFGTLMAHRRSIPPPIEWANSLNLIDIVYADHPKVVELWHECYGILNRQGGPGSQEWNHRYIEMLSAMAAAVGYKRLTQTDIDKFYQPQVHGEASQRQAEISTEFLRVLRASENFGTARDDGPEIE